MQYNSSFMTKITVPSPVFRGYDNTMMKVKLCKVYTRSNVNKGKRFASGKYAGAFRIASFNKKTCNHRENKMCRKKYKNTQLFLQVRN